MTGIVLFAQHGHLVGKPRRENWHVEETFREIAGLGGVLYPDLDIWQTGKPVLKAWMIEQTGPKATLRRLRREWPDLRYALEKLPLVARKLVDEALDDKPQANDATGGQEFSGSAAAHRNPEGMCRRSHHRQSAHGKRAGKHPALCP